VEILTQARSRYQQYVSDWQLTITCTTNAIVGKRVWRQVVHLVDEFTVSYHAENLKKQKNQFKENLLYLKSVHKRFNCIVMMHNDPVLWADSESIMDFCKQHDINYTPKPVDKGTPEWQYSATQFNKLKVFWLSKTSVNEQSLMTMEDDVSEVCSLSAGRSCCGGRLMSVNADLKSRVSFIPKQGFQGWSCSVNWFFLFVRQLTGEIYTNKDCMTSTTGRVEPLGTLQNYQLVLDTLSQQFTNNAMPVIKCVKSVCRCGFCAPKAQDHAEFQQLIKRHVPHDVFSGKTT
jgi:hypothetical protein